MSSIFFEYLAEFFDPPLVLFVLSSNSVNWLKYSNI